MRPGKPLISVVIPVHNSAKTLGETLASVAAQTFRNLEVVIGDDHSTDSSVEAARSAFPGLRAAASHRHGAAAARNAALSQARGELVAFLDADDLWKPEKLEVQIELLRRHPRCTLIGGEAEQFDGDNIARACFVQQLFPSLERDCEPLDGIGCRVVDPLRRLAMGNFIVTSSALAPRELVERIGGMNPDLPYSEDFALWGRLAMLGDVGFIPRPLVRYRRAAATLSHRYGPLQRQRYKIAALRYLVEHGMDRRFYRLGRACSAVSLASDALAAGNRWDAIRLLAEAARYYPFQRRLWLLSIRSIMPGAVARALSTLLRRHASDNSTSRG